MSTITGNDLSEKTKEKYIRLADAMKEELKKTNQSPENQSKEFSDVMEKMDGFSEKVSGKEVNFDKLQLELSSVVDSINAYRRIHEGTKDHTEVKRLYVMEKFEELSNLSNLYEKDPIGAITKSKTTKELENKIQKIEKENESYRLDSNDGLVILSLKAEESYKRLYDKMTGKTPITEENKAEIKQDLRTITLHTIVREEENLLHKQGYVSEAVKNMPSEVDSMIKSTTIPGMEKYEALKNPTKENIEAMLFGDRSVESLVKTTVDSVHNESDIRTEKRIEHKANKEKRRENREKRKEEVKKNSLSLS